LREALVSENKNLDRLPLQQKNVPDCLLCGYNLTGIPPFR
jgi:hypothetical protein